MSHAECRQMEKGKAGQSNSVKRVNVLFWIKKTKNRYEAWGMLQSGCVKLWSHWKVISYIVVFAVHILYFVSKGLYRNHLWALICDASSTCFPSIYNPFYISHNIIWILLASFFFLHCKTLTSANTHLYKANAPIICRTKLPLLCFQATQYPGPYHSPLPTALSPLSSIASLTFQVMLREISARQHLPFPVRDKSQSS